MNNLSTLWFDSSFVTANIYKYLERQSLQFNGNDHSIAQAALSTIQFMISLTYPAANISEDSGNQD